MGREQARTKEEREHPQDIVTFQQPEDELNVLLSRAAELEDTCLELEQQHAMLEHQVKAAQLLIRQKQKEQRQAKVKNASRGCPHCEHCRLEQWATPGTPGQSDPMVVSARAEKK